MVMVRDRDGIKIMIMVLCGWWAWGEFWCSNKKGFFALMYILCILYNNNLRYIESLSSYSLNSSYTHATKMITHNNKNAEQMKTWQRLCVCDSATWRSAVKCSSTWCITRRSKSSCSATSAVESRYQSPSPLSGGTSHRYVLQLLPKHDYTAQWASV